MFEGAIAAFLNRLLGRYVEDLDTEQLNIGIFSGDTCLTDLKLKPEALYQLGLPIRVEIGLIGKIILKIPWSGLFSQPIVLCIEDIYIIAAPSMCGIYNAEIQKRLTRAEKKKILEDMEYDNASKFGLPTDLFDSLVTSVIRNFQITINNVHIRYEERISKDLLCACGVCIQSISMTTTNNKWKPGTCTTNSQTAYQLIRMESLSVYVDHDAEPCLASCLSTSDVPCYIAWKSSMYRGLQTFGMKNKEFQFLLKPFTGKIKVIIHKGNETQSSRMLVDVVMQDMAMQISEVQYITICQLYDSLLRAVINRPHRKYRPNNGVKENSSSWWKYAYNSIVEYNIRPYNWANILTHRNNYRKYKETYAQSLLRPNDTELKLDLQKYEDSLTILNIVIAREHAKQELRITSIDEQHADTKFNILEEETTEVTLENRDNIQDKNMSSVDQEHKRLSYYIVDNGPSAKIKLEKLTRPIDYKYNFTLVNCSLSLLNKDREVLVITVTQFLTSIEAQPALSAFKISARAESCVIEGASVDGDLVPLITVDNILTGNVCTNFVAIDFEKCGINMDPNFEISAKLEATEVTYNHYAVMEIIKFFEFNDTYAQDTTLWSYKIYDMVKRRFLDIVADVVSQTLRICFKIDIKGPYIVFPEHGTMQKGGHLLLIDFGNIHLSNELQAVGSQLEDATLMEMEELLYDRLNIMFSGAQILFCDSGDDWRSARKRKDSEYHLVSQIQANTTLSYSTRPEYRQLPRAKLNISISNMKINFSENKLRLILHFENLLVTLHRSQMQRYKQNVKESFKEKKRPVLMTSIKDLLKVCSNVCVPSVSYMQTECSNAVKEVFIQSVAKLDRNIVSSEVSEEDLELLAKTITLSGFDDNVSPCNRIDFLLRFAIGELSFLLGYVTCGREQPYLHLRLQSFYLETAIMEYGPAIQVGIGSFILVDKTSVGVTGSYLELVSTGDSHEALVLSYRKVKSNCPDFKSHFKNIERSLIVNLLNINIIFHRTAVLKAREHLKKLEEICQGYSLHDRVKRISQNILLWKEKENDPPIPPGAIKLSYSARLGELVIRFCDKDSDLMDIKITGLENDCIYNVNERMILRGHLRNLIIEDLDVETLYAKILATDEDKVLDLKYVRHTPRLYVCPDIDTNQDDVMSDGIFKLSLGRINILLISKILKDLQHFLAPFTPGLYSYLIHYVGNKLTKSIEEFKRSATKLHIFIDLQGPVFLLPQRKDAPSLLVFDTGLLSVENFFKKVDNPTLPVKAQSTDTNHYIIDNILLKLKAVTVSRAIIMLRGDLEVQEPIVEPVYVHFDIKRKTEYRSVLEPSTCGLFSVQGSIDFVFINVSQKDLKSMILVWNDNISKILISKTVLELEEAANTNDSLDENIEDGTVKQLEVFLAHNETVFCEVNMKLTLEGLQLNLFFDSEEVLSSPMRDLSHGLCKLCFGEMISILDLYNNKSLKVKLSVQSCSLQDTRKSAVIVKKIIQCPARLIGMNVESCISVSMSPIVDVTYTQAPTGDKCLDILVQETRVNLSMPFLMHLGHYLIDSLPSEQIDEGIINHGYESFGQTMTDNITTTGMEKFNRAQCFQQQPDTCISVRIQKPEILLFGDLKASNAHVILLQAEISLESSQHGDVSNVVCTLTDVRAKSKSQGQYYHRHPRWLLSPCDIEICKKEDMRTRMVEINVLINSIEIHLSAEILHTFMDIINEATSFLNSTSLKSENKYVNYDSHVYSDLWTPKKILNIPYKHVENGEKSSINRSMAKKGNQKLYSQCGNQTVNIFLKPVSVRVLLEMDSTPEKLPVIRTEIIVVQSILDWYNNFQLESIINISSFCYNSSNRRWEPLIELCTDDERKYKPWELIVKMCYGEVSTVNPNWIDPCHFVNEDLAKKKGKHLKCNEPSDMVFISPDHTVSSKVNEAYPQLECDDSESDEDDNSKKLTRNFHYLFNDNSSTDEDSDTDDSSTNRDDEPGEDAVECNIENHCPCSQDSQRTVQPTMYIMINAEDVIKFTLTSDTILVVNNILNAFTQAKNDIPIVPTGTGKLSLQNNIGHESQIELLAQEEIDGKMVTRVIAATNYHGISSPPSPPSSPELEVQSVGCGGAPWFGNGNDFADPDDNVQCRPTPQHDIFYDDSPVQIYKEITGELVHIIFPGFENIFVYCPRKEGCNLIPLRPIKHDVRYHLVIEVTLINCLHRTISVRSPLQFHNETSYALGLYYKKQLVEKLNLPHVGETTNPFDDNIRMAIIEPDSTYSIPLYIAYHFPIHVLPEYLEKHEVSNEGIYWKDLNDMKNPIKDIYCKSKCPESRAVFSVKVLSTELPPAVRPGCHVPNYLISILPSLIFNNQLPFVIDIEIPYISYSVKIEPGEKINMHSLRWDTDVQFIFKIQSYLGTQWTGSITMNSSVEQKFVSMSSESETEQMKPFTLCIQLHKIRSWNIIIQAQYWIINKSGLPLYIQDCYSHAMYEIAEKELMAFSQKNKKRSIVRVRAHQSEWCLPFGLDGIGSMSLIICKDPERGRKYRILTEIESSRLSPCFTKILTFLPYFFIENNTKRTLRFMEVNDEADLWNDLLPGQNVPFWPVTETMKMKVKWKNSQLVSQHFDITQIGRTVLRMDNGSGLCVEIKNGVGSPYLIIFERYTSGDAPVRIDNLCDELFLKISQVDSGQVTLLNPFQSLLYTWDDPTVPRHLIWNVYNNKHVGYKAQFETDGFGQEMVSLLTVEQNPSRRLSVDDKSLAMRYKLECTDNCKAEGTQQKIKDKTLIYWVSYMEGEQRVLLFTQYESVFFKVRSTIEPEPSEKEIFLSLAGVGVSFISKSNGLTQEFMHATIMNSAAHWELCFGKKWKSLSLELSAWVESVYANSPRRAQVADFIEVDLVKLQMTKPFFGKLRRIYSPGVSLLCRKSETFTYLQGYIHRIQVDNQLRDAFFPVVLHSTMEKSLVNFAGNRKLKHCIEFVCLKQRKPKCTVYKGISIIVRELNVNLQEEFLLLLSDLIPKRTETKHTIAAKLRKDVANIRVPSFCKDMHISTEKRRNVLERLYISPIVLRLRLQAKIERYNLCNHGALNEYCNIVKYIFQYAQNGAFEKQAVFRLPHCVRRFATIVDEKSLLSDLGRNYMVQITQQFRVLIQSTTVLGNPHGYNFKNPGDLFYDPGSLIICGDEVPEKLCYDIACYLGHTTGDGSQRLAFKFDNCESYTSHTKGKELYFENSNVPPVMFFMDNAFSTEIELEMAALIKSSIHSIHQEEAKYLFKTLGKKMAVLFKIGSSSLKSCSKVIADIIKRAQEIGHKFVYRVRLPRYINPYTGVELLSMHMSKGMHLLYATNKGHSAHNDTYWAHTALSNEGKSIALVSLQRVYLIEKECEWGAWSVKWTIDTNQLLSPPAVVNDKLVLHVNKNEDSASPVVDWYLESKEAGILEWLCRKINTAMILNMESSICSKQDA